VPRFARVRERRNPGATGLPHKQDRVNEHPYSEALISKYPLSGRIYLVRSLHCSVSDRCVRSSVKGSSSSPSPRRDGSGWSTHWRSCRPVIHRTSGPASETFGRHHSCRPEPRRALDPVAEQRTNSCPSRRQYVPTNPPWRAGKRPASSLRSFQAWRSNLDSLPTTRFCHALPARFGRTPGQSAKTDVPKLFPIGMKTAPGESSGGRFAW
jgi:hypothetical protein